MNKAKFEIWKKLQFEFFSSKFKLIISIEFLPFLCPQLCTQAILDKMRVQTTFYQILFRPPQIFLAKMRTFFIRAF